jgi:hypothetical protein
MRRIRLVGFGALALAAIGIFFLKPSGTGSDPRVVALLSLLVLVVVWHFATLRRARREAVGMPPGPVEAPAPSSEDVVDRGSAAPPPLPFSPGAISPTEVLPPDAEVVPQGPSDEQFDMDAPPPGTPDAPDEDRAAAAAAEHVQEPIEEPSLPAPPPEPQYKDGFEKWAAEMFGPNS